MSNRVSMLDGAGGYKKHPLPREARIDIEKGMVNVPENGAVFWSNYWVLRDGKARSANRDIAESHCRAKNALQWSDRYFTLEMTDAGRKFEEAWNDPTVPDPVKIKLGEIYSREFARRAKGDITVCTNNTNLPSFFRRVELPEIMANPSIRRIHWLMVADKNEPDPYTVLTLPKEEWYQRQRDQWLDSTIHRLGEVADAHDSNDPLYVDSALAFLLEAQTAQIEASRLKQQIRTQSGDKEAQQWQQDLAREEQRLGKCREVLEDVPELKKFKSLPSVQKTVRELLKFEKGKLGPDSRLNSFNAR